MVTILVCGGKSVIISHLYASILSEFIMSFENYLTQLPDYDEFAECIANLQLPFSASELHGILCGYICAGIPDKAEAYLRALTSGKHNEATKTAQLVLFGVYSLSQQQIDNLDFEFQLLLPGDHASLGDRAQAFTEWCTGFNQGMTVAGISPERLIDEEAQDILHHLQEFAKLDYDALEISEEDEKSLMEVSEYTRMGVLKLRGEIIEEKKGGAGGSRLSH